MAGITRRRFCWQASGAMAALSAHPRIAAPAAIPPTGRLSGAPVDARAIAQFASSIAGHVITPGATDYDSARVIFNRAFDRHPVLIVKCANATDIARALEFAQNYSLPLAVRGGGHNRAGFSTCDDGMVIDLSAMNRVEVDGGKRIARVAAGALSIHLDAATQRVGLATTTAGCPTVGIAGLTLGGGEGMLMSKFGAACDNLLSAELVTVDGRLVKASHDANRDLFWAIRGGGGNFGVVTRLEYRLHPLTDVLAGTLVFPSGRVAELLQAFAGFVTTAPDEMNVVGQVLTTAEGARFQMLVCHCGDPLVGNKLLGALRAFNPRQDDVRISSYVQANATVNPAAPAAHFQTNLFVTDLSEAAIATLVAASSDAPPNTRVFMVPFYGAITRVALSDTAFALRSRGYELDIMGRWNDPAERPRAVRWVEALRDALQPLARGVYVNQLGETSEKLVRAAYGAHYARLAAIKAKYDPKNVLRLNQNIKPA